jgi:predicted hydrocarbon binding protein
LVAGAVETVLGKEVRAKEVKCIGGLGHESCSFDIDVR